MFRISMKNPHWVKRILRLLGLFLFVFIIIKVGTENLFFVISSTQWEFVATAAVLSAGHFCIKALRWHYILSKQQISVSRFRTILAYCSGSLIGALTPGRIGEVAKVVFVRSWEKDSSWGTAFGTVVLDRIADLALLVIIAIVGAVWFVLPDIFYFSGGVLVLIITVLTITAGLFIKKKAVLSNMMNKVINYLKNKFGDNSIDFWKSLKFGSGPNKWVLILWTLLAYAFFFAHFVFLSLAIGSELPPAVLIWGITVACIGAMLPISISGIGVRDYILVQLFITWGGTSAQGFAVSILYLSIFNLVVAIIGIWPFVIGDLNMKMLTKGENK